MSEKIFISPSKYVQGRDTVEKAGEYIADLGKKAMIILIKRSGKLPQIALPIA